MAIATCSVSGLPGTNGREITAAIFRTAKNGRALLAHRPAITAAGDRGAINCWRDDKGFYRCERMVRFITRAEGRFPDLDGVERWLEKELPAIYEEKL